MSVQGDGASAPDTRMGWPDTGLSDTAVASACGNMVLEPGEDCEDGNRQSGDGCDPACHYEPGLYAGCGDGKFDPRNEGCDDGNRQSGDGCSAFCCMEACYACTDGCILPTLRTCRCGNGILEWGEECDDGNLKPGDGCNQYCGVERATCGNGVLDKGEQCDDGNRDNNDHCVACFYDPPSLICSTMGVCADGRVSGPESCDDGNVLPGDGCSANCTVEPGYYCPTPGKHCVRAAPSGSCGNGTLEPGEACDDGINDGRYGGCNPNCSLGPRCGDEIVQPEHEICDLGGRNVGGYGGCKPDCSLGPYCGDGLVQTDYEECDSAPSCMTTCRFPRKP